MDQTVARGEPMDQSDANYQARLPMMTEADFALDKYSMAFPNCGIAIVINNKHFDPKTGLRERSGTDVDAMSMTTLLRGFGFNVHRHNNLTALQMRAKLQEVSQIDHSGNACLVCVILSHGEEGYVFGTDDKIEIDELLCFFKGNRCVSLAGKPKLFFVQACGNLKLERDLEEVESGMESSEEERITRHIPTEADFLMAYSVVPGTFAWHHSICGSWFIQAIHDIFLKYWHNTDLMTMMIKVNKKVAYEFQHQAHREFIVGNKRIPCITSMLTKQMYFRKKETMV